MFNNKCTAVRNQLSLLSIPLQEQPKVLAYAAAVVISVNGNLPSSPVDAPSGYYSDNVAVNVNKFISDFNENFIIDVGVASRAARNLWLLRYQSAHTPKLALYSKKFDFFCGITGVELLFSDDEYADMTKHKDSINKLALAILEICED